MKKMLVMMLIVLSAIFLSSCREPEIKKEVVHVPTPCPKMRTFDAIESCRIKVRLLLKQAKNYNHTFSKKEKR